MNQGENLLSESDSARLAGVSIETIKQYRQFGLLEATLKDGITHYREKDIRGLFYTKSEDSTPSNKEPVNKTSVEEDEESKNTGAFTRTVSLAKRAAKERAKAQQSLSGSDSNSTSNQPPESSNPLAADQATTTQAQTTQTKRPDSVMISEAEELPTLDSILADISEIEATAVEDVTVEMEAINLEDVADNKAPEQVEESEPAQKAAFHSSAEATNSTGLLNDELRERIHLLVEQLAQVRDERDWLRRRIEMLEARSEREQMLLLTESNTVRNLISSATQNRRGFWRTALPWLGGSDK